MQTQVNADASQGVSLCLLRHPAPTQPPHSQAVVQLRLARLPRRPGAAVPRLVAVALLRPYPALLGLHCARRAPCRWERWEWCEHSAALQQV